MRIFQYQFLTITFWFITRYKTDTKKKSTKRRQDNSRLYELQITLIIDNLHIKIKPKLRVRVSQV